MPSRFHSPRHVSSLLLIFLLALSACKRIEKDLPLAVTKAVEAVKQKYCPDPRLCVFDVHVQIRGANLKLMGELSDAAARRELVQAVKAAMPDFKVEDEILFLPDEALPRNERFGLISVSVANLRSKPGHAAELALQQLMGSSVAILKKEGTWYYVQTEDQYLAWIPNGSLQVGEQSLIEEWRASDLVAFKNMHGLVRAEARLEAPPLSNVVLGNVLRRLPEAFASSNTKTKWLSVALPDGRQGYIENEMVTSAHEFYPQAPTSPAAVVTQAQRMLGVPYLWGGTSVAGFDCSGFTQTVFRLNGIPLLRDASQQARQGTPLAVSNDFAELQPGDLLFFGEKENRITHVALSLGGPRFIHASDYVRSNSLNEADADYVESRKKTFQFAKRFFNATN